MKDKSGFFASITSYIKKGTISPIYASDRLAVLRVADSFYVASDYTKGKRGFIALLVNSKMIRAMMVDESFFQQMLTTYDREALASMMFELDRSTFQRFRKGTKDNPISDLTHRFVDDQLEKWIFDTYGKAEIPEPVNKGILGFLKK